MEKREYPALGERVFYRRLSNGLSVYVDVKPGFSKQFAFFAVSYGGMDLRFRSDDGSWVDTPAGVAHFLEHKLFDTGDGKALGILAANGADNNAFTSATVTGYYFEGTRGFEENLETLLSFVTAPCFSKESVDRERGIITQEIRMGEDDPDTAIYYMLLEGLYREHPVRGKVIGSEESVSRITDSILYQCHRAFYRPGNMVLCVAGDVDPEGVAAIAEKVLPAHCGGTAEKARGTREPEEVNRARMEREMEVSAPQFQIGFKGDPPGEGLGLYQRLLAELVCDVLFSPSAPLYTRLYEEGLINNTFGSGYESVPGCAFLTVGGESREPETVLARVREEIARVLREGIDPVLWERQRKAAYGAAVRRLNSMEDTCIELALGHFDGEEYLSFPQVYQQLERADGERLLRRWCTEERTAMAVILPNGESEQEIEE